MINSKNITSKLLRKLPENAMKISVDRYYIYENERGRKTPEIKYSTEFTRQSDGFWNKTLTSFRVYNDTTRETGRDMTEDMVLAEVNNFLQEKSRLEDNQKLKIYYDYEELNGYRKTAPVKKPAIRVNVRKMF